MTDLEIQTISITFKVATLSALLVVPFSVFCAVLINRLSQRTQIFAVSLLSIPMALPPVITGYLLLLFLGRGSTIGSFLFDNFGIQLSFSFAGAVICSSVVAFPLALRSVLVSVKSVNPIYLDAAATLGLSNFKTFVWILLPLSWPGILGAGILAFVRAFGEFGATAVFAGGLFGGSRTLSVEVFHLLQIPSNEDVMWRLLTASLLFCFIALIISEVFFSRMKVLCEHQ